MTEQCVLDSLHFITHSFIVNATLFEEKRARFLKPAVYAILIWAKNRSVKRADVFGSIFVILVNVQANLSGTFVCFTSQPKL